MHDDKIGLIKKANSNLNIKKIEFIESGFHSLAVVVNNEYIFRFPLEREFFDEYINEQKLLDLLNDKISTQIPSVELFDVDGEVFTKHKMIIGEQYTSISEKMTDDKKSRLSKDIAKFLAELHGVETDSLAASQFSIDDYEINENLDVLHNYLGDNKRIKDFNVLLEEFNDKTSNLKEENIVVCHNDLNENNILVDSKTKKLAGIIDFGNSIKRDFSSEFASLLKYDFELVLKIVNEYQKLTNREVDLEYAVLLQKIRCYGGIVEALNNENQARVKIYEKWLERIDLQRKSSLRGAE